MVESPKISVVVPFFNEAESVQEFHRVLLAALQKLQVTFEIIFVDDGSTDKTLEYMRALKPARVLFFTRNYGQTAALGVGIGEARGEIIITLDGDLENRPEDISKLLVKLEEGFDIVSGWRQDRWKDKLFTRRIPSKLANHMISFVTGVYLHDHGCTLKAYRKKFVKNINFIGDMHRIIAAYAVREGAKLTEIPVQFEPRRHGKSKYGFSRTFKVLLDILAFHFFYKYARRPIHFFRALGFVSFFLAGVMSFIAVYLRVTQDIHFIRTPLPMLVAIFVVVGFQFILMGLLAEIISRNSQNKIEYFESHGE